MRDGWPIPGIDDDSELGRLLLERDAANARARDLYEQWWSQRDTLEALQKSVDETSTSTNPLEVEASLRLIKAHTFSLQTIVEQRRSAAQQVEVAKMVTAPTLQRAMHLWQFATGQPLVPAPLQGSKLMTRDEAQQALDQLIKAKGP